MPANAGIQKATCVRREAVEPRDFDPGVEHHGILTS